MTLVKIGDVLAIPLEGNMYGFAQHVFSDKQFGPLIKVFDLKKPVPEITQQEIENAEELFPPVITGIKAAVRTGLWKVVGRFPVKDFKYPRFVRNLYSPTTGEAGGVWFLWDGSKTHRLGSRLKKQHKKLEFLVVWSPFDIAWRIETGEYPFPYGDLIHKNRVTPRVNK